MLIALNTGDKRTADNFLEKLALHEAQIFGFLCSIVWDFNDAEDLFQQTILTMWEKFENFREDSDFTAWGCAIAKNKAMTMFRSRKKGIVLSDAVMDRLASYNNDSKLDRDRTRIKLLEACLSELQPEDRKLIELYYRNDFDAKEIAKYINRSVASIYNSLSKTRKALFNCVNRKMAQDQC